MWLWLQNGLKKNPIWFKLLGVSCCVHASALFLLLVAYRGYYAQYHLTMTPQAHVPVIFMPLHKTIQQNTTAAGSHKTSEQSAAMPQKVVEKKKVLPPTALVNDVKTQASKKKKQQAKKSKKKKPKKAKKLAKPKEKPRIVESPKIVEQPKPLEGVATQDLVATSTDAQQPGRPVYVGQVELEALQLQQAVQHEVESHWRPPTGLSPELLCVVKITVDWNGTIGDVVIEKKSGVLAFDLSARKAVMAMKLPKFAWGKDLHIDMRNTKA